LELPCLHVSASADKRTKLTEGCSTLVAVGAALRIKQLLLRGDGFFDLLLGNATAQ
jgi:hypothetical protein